jgi:NAD(P)-dependent dehydrogenase (short-subunit alcohol dehydrogenase family)
MGSLSGKVAFITGAARGQGRAHAVKLASEGAEIIAVDLCDQIASVPYPMATADDLNATVKLVEETGVRIVAQEADVRDRAALKTALKAGVEELGGRLDIVIANAGIAPMTGEDAWQDVIDVNLTGVYHTIDVAMRPMIKAGNGGSIVLTSSVAGLVGLAAPQAGSIGYAAAKHGMVGLMRVYANLLGSLDPDGHHRTGRHRQHRGVAGLRRGSAHHRRDLAGRRGIHEQALTSERWPGTRLRPHTGHRVP